MTETKKKGFVFGVFLLHSPRRTYLPVAASSGLAHGHPCPPLGGGLAHGPANHARLPVATPSGLAHGHPCPPARGARTRAGQRTTTHDGHARTTTHDDENMLSAHKGTTPETPIDGVR